MPSRLRSSAKTIIRSVLRRAGYDVVPLASGFVEAQRRALRGVDSVFDVGANVGQYAERLRDIGYRNNIISFEPAQDAFRLLDRKAARDRNWKARNAALGPTKGNAMLRLSANSVSSSLLDVAEVHLRAAPRSKTVAHERVEVTTLDAEINEQSDRAIFLKLDVQGYELPVLRGGERTLGRTAAIQVEVSFDSLYRGQTSWLELCGFLQERSFAVRAIAPGYEDTKTGFMLQADLLLVRHA